MKDFPVFTTQYGVASLVLKQIPYSGCAYITIQDSCSPYELLKECSDFCQAVGASCVYASGHECLSKYPRHTEIVLMRCQREQLADTDAALFPVCSDTLERFREIYNDAMGAVPNASYMTAADAEKVLADGNGYFIHRDGTLLGIGIAGGERIEAIASLIAGSGSDVMRALNHALTGSVAEVEVATTNARAISLYNKLGFVCCKELSRWYKIV